MLLSKRCSKNYNIKKSKTIKLGSLYEYRDIESEQIVDKDEGKLEILVSFEGDVPVKRKLLNTVFRGALGLGDDNGVRNVFSGIYHTNIINYETPFGFRSDQEIVIVRNSAAQISQQAYNCFIFCMSKIRKPGEADGIFPDYDDCWYMDFAHKERFAYNLGNLLLKQITQEFLRGSYLIPQETDISKLTALMIHDEIFYSRRVIEINNNTHQDTDGIAKKIGNIAFTKPEDPFAVEKEYRFSYVLFSNGKLIQPTVKSVVLDATHLMGFVANV